MVDSEIIQCPVCGNWRHKSAFSVGRRGCSDCQEAHPEHLAGLDRLHQKLQESERLILKQIILEMMTEGPMPDELTGTEKRILLARAEGHGAASIAEGLGMKPNRMTSIEHTAQAKITRLAKERMPAWIAAHN